uniref:Leucine-rich repeat-containing N-terminal plant-type domain-containing protein n=1 Tax=Manihot esculenta TaxID=3983 RepID=A0A199U9D6_MANES
MESPSLFVRLLSFLMLTTLCHAIAFTQSFNSSIQRCHDDESLALLQFKNSFNISSSCSYSKLESWKLNQGVRSGESCSWDGVECDEKTNHVVSLDLSESCIYGSINSNSTLFRLVHLQRLNLGSNNFIHSQISSEIVQLSRLTHLDLSFSGFSAEIPAEISNLSSLVSLDLSCNLDFISYDGLLKLRQASFRGLVQNMTNLKELDLECVDISSTVLANLSSLESLHLCGCELHGEFPASFLACELKDNRLMRKYKSNRSHLERLRLFSTSFYGKNQHGLEYLDLSSNSLQAQIPSWMCSISTNSMDFLNLSHNLLTGFEQNPVIFHWAQIRNLDLRSNQLQGSLPLPPPSTISYLISHNQLTGELSPLICNLYSLEILDLSFNNLSRQLPHCLSNSSDLSVLDLRRNNFHGIIPAAWRDDCKLRMISISYNQLQGQVPKSLANCSSLQLVDFGNNQITDTFPSWLGNLSELRILILRSNQFYGVIDQKPKTKGFPSLRIIDLSGNSFVRKLPSVYLDMWEAMKTIQANHMTYMGENIRPNFTDVDTYYGEYDYSMTMFNKGVKLEYEKIQDIFLAIDFSNNRFEGKIPEIIGNLKGLNLLNLSNNLLKGHIPPSLASLGSLEGLV